MHRVRRLSSRQGFTSISIHARTLKHARMEWSFTRCVATLPRSADDVAAWPHRTIDVDAIFRIRYLRFNQKSIRGFEYRISKPTRRIAVFSLRTIPRCRVSHGNGILPRISGRAGLIEEKHLAIFARSRLRKCARNDFIGDSRSVILRETRGRYFRGENFILHFHL